jgi:excisionase family DNA binding protein
VSEPLALSLSPEAVEAIADRAAEIVIERQREAEAGSPWLSVADAAAYLWISGRQLQRAITKGRVTSTTIGRRRLLHRDELDRFARAATGENVAPATSPRHREG